MNKNTDKRFLGNPLDDIEDISEYIDACGYLGLAMDFDIDNAKLTEDQCDKACNDISDALGVSVYPLSEVTTGKRLYCDWSHDYRYLSFEVQDAVTQAFWNAVKRALES